MAKHTKTRIANCSNRTIFYKKQTIASIVIRYTNNIVLFVKHKQHPTNPIERDPEVRV